MWHLFCYCNKLLCFLFIYTGLFVCLFVYLKIDFFIAHKSDCFTYHKKNFWAFDIEYDDLYGSWSPFLPHLALNPCPFPTAHLSLPSLQPLWTTSNSQCDCFSWLSGFYLYDSVCSEWFFFPFNLYFCYFFSY